MAHAPAAHAWSPIKPAVCSGNPAWTIVNYDFNVNSARWDLAEDPYCTVAGSCPRYIDNIKYNIRFLGNAWTTALYVHFDAFELENFYDNVVYGTKTWTANLGPAWVDWVTTGGKSMLTERPLFTFTTDISIGRTTGISVDKVSLCSSRASAETGTPPLASDSDRHSGFLLGIGDVIYAQTVKPADRHKTIALWSDTAGVDFDLYARCGALPTSATYDYRSIRGGAKEFIEYGNSCNSPIYIAIVSFSGSGSFHLTVNQHFSGSHKRLRAGANWALTDADLNWIDQTLREGARLFYGQTEGNWMLDRMDIYRSSNNCANCGGRACDICFKNEGGRPSASCNQQLTMRGNNSDAPEMLAHELGHSILCVLDEYHQPAQGSSQYQCGHSNMASPWTANHNHCTTFDHTRDGDPAAPTTPLMPVWEMGTGLIGTGARTYDNYSYRDFDFAGWVGAVSRFP